MALQRIAMPSPCYSSRGGAKVRLIVLHTAEGARTIESLGGFFGNAANQVSSHAGIDDQAGKVGIYVRRGYAAWTQGNANPVAVSAELCGFARWSEAVWKGQHANMLANCAAWLAEESAALGIPLTKLTPAQAKAGGRGVCQHIDLGLWGGGHVDCGNGFPIDYVLALARSGGQPEAKDELLMQPGYMIKGVNAVTPVAFPNGAVRLRLFSNQAATVTVDWIGEGGGASPDVTLGYDAGPQGLKIPDGIRAACLRRRDGGDNEVSFVLTA